MRLAHETGKSLNELMGWQGPMTHRQMDAWRCWFSEIDKPPDQPGEYKGPPIEDWDERVAYAKRDKLRLEAERTGGTFTVLKKGDPRVAADLLREQTQRKLADGK